MRFTSLFIPWTFLVVCLGLCAQSTRPNVLPITPPSIFFSDLESGPNVGAQKNRGVWVTIWGKGFGAQRGHSTVTIGGGTAADYPVWTDTKITFQLGTSARTGPVIVTVKGKNFNIASNGLPFTVRKGKIYFVATNGSDWSNGSVATPVE